MEKQINLQGANSKYLDWVGSLELISDKTSKTILEFGCGFGTQYLCNEFAKVYSFEVYGTREWYDKTVELLSQWDNWEGRFYTPIELELKEAIETIYINPNVRNESAFHTNGGLYDKLSEFVDLSKIDVAFVDHSMNMRGETVNYLMEIGIPIIFAHDTKHGHSTYGWNKIEKNPNYEVSNYNCYQGVTYWIKK